jgi:tetratricopeptide (TPR) repeat protein
MVDTLKVLSERARQFQESGKLEDAIRVYREAAQFHSGSAVAEHNLAAALGDAGRATEAESHIRKALAKGLDAPESWLVLARALQAQGKLDDAAEAFRKCISLNPQMRVALFEYAQLIWMTTADSKAALAPLDAQIRSNPGNPGLLGTKARVMMYCSGPETTYEFVAAALGRWPNDPGLLGTGIDAATLIGESDAALRMSDRLISLQPESVAAKDMRMYALLAAGRADEALPISESLCNSDPDDQHALAMYATACRLLGDARFAALYNYEQFVRSYDIAVPDGWTSLGEYLSDLGTALRERHPFKTHPFSNSEEHGSKISDLLAMDDPAIKAFPEALGPAVEAHIEHLGAGTDPLRARVTGRWKIDGIWSVWLRPGGYHHNHVHPRAWLSSACYIELPDRVSSEGREGWIKFGEPGVVTDPRLEYEHALKPEPGMLVLFPSYMWHGTIPFSGDEPRLTIALDILPA